MREVTGATVLAMSQTLAGAAGWAPLVWSWKDGRLLTPEPMPVLRGRLVGSADARVPDRLELTVPAWADGRSWVPEDDTEHPLAEYGQTLSVAVLVRSTVRGEVVTRLGMFGVHGTRYDDAEHTVDVTAFGVLQQAAEHGFSTPEGPRTGATLISELRRLAPPGMSVYVDAAVEDRACPQSFQWPDDRLDALYEIVDAIPARLHVDQHGTVQVLPPLPEVPAPVLTLTDGRRGTVVSTQRSSSRSGRPNRVIATGSSVDAAALDPVVGVADITSGPMAVTEDGTGYRVVTDKWSSPLLETSRQAYAAARTRLARLSRPAKVRTVYCAPDPRIELDDAVEILSGSTVVRDQVVVTPRTDAVTHDVVRTNRNPNPSLETNLTGYTAARVTLARSNAWAADGTWSLETVSTGVSADCYATVGGDGGALRLGMQPGKTYTASATAQVPAALTGATGVVVRIYYRSSTGTYFSAVSAAAPASGGTARLSATITIPAGATEAFVRLYNSSPVAGAVVRWDNVMVEEGSVAGEPFHGDTPDTPSRQYAWTGAAHASTSTETTTIVDEPAHPAVTRTVARTVPTRREWGYVVGYELPLTIADGKMRLDVAVTS